MKRFKIINSSKNVVYTADTTQECYEYLLTQDLGLNRFMIECTVDDIEIDSDEFILEIVKFGECPIDLQKF